MAVEIMTEPTEELRTAINTLIPQLSSSAKPMTPAELEAFVSQKGVYQFAFRSDASGEILGLLTLVTFDIPTAKRSWIEDVVVDEGARGQGAGRALVEAAVAKATEVGAVTTDLTTRPFRTAANRLYRSCGFEQRETNVYRYQA